MEEIYKRSEKARRWIKLCVFPAFIPVGFSIFYDFYTGYTLFQVIDRHFLDTILACFALAASIFSSAVSLTNNDEKKVDYICISVAWGLICTFLYAVFYARFNKLSWVTIVARIFLFVMGYKIIYKGMQVEEALEKETLKKETSVSAAGNP